VSYKVRLDVFSGPMDLLLYLVSKEEVEICDIPIAGILDQYMEHLEEMRSRNMEVAGEFIIMASKLMLIKSRMLLPREEIDLEEEIDPRDELVQQLIEYKKFKTLSRALDDKGKNRGMMEGRPRTLDQADEIEIPLEEVDLFDLVRAFSTILEDTGYGLRSTIIHTDKPIYEHIKEIVGVLRSRPDVPFREIFATRRSLDEALGTFIGLLELCRLSIVKLSQKGHGAEIEVKLCADNEKLDRIEGGDLEAIFVDKAEEDDKALWREAIEAGSEAAVAGAEEAAPPETEAVEEIVAAAEETAPSETEPVEEPVAAAAETAPPESEAVEEVVAAAEDSTPPETDLVEEPVVAAGKPTPSETDAVEEPVTAAEEGATAESQPVEEPAAETEEAAPPEPAPQKEAATARPKPAPPEEAEGFAAF